MNIKKILELQTLMMELNKINNEFNGSEIAQKYLKSKNLRDVKKQAFLEATAQLSSIDSQVDELVNQIKESLEEVDELANSDYSGIDETELKDEEAMLLDCEAKIKALTTKLDQMKMQSTDTNRNLKRLYSEFQQITAEREKLKPLFEQAAQATKIKLDEINTKIKKQKEEMAESDVALYETTRQNTGKAKAFVTLVGKNCKGCGLEVEPSAYNKIITDGFGTCPNCHRIIYINEN